MKRRRDPVIDASDAIEEIIAHVLGDVAEQLRAALGAYRGARPGRARPRPAPAPEVTDDGREAVRAAAAVLGLAGKRLTPATVKARRKALARTHHPDRPGGNAERMKRINAAADFLLSELEGAK